MSQDDGMTVIARCEVCEKPIPDGQEVVHPEEGDSYCARCVVDLIGAERDALARQLAGAVGAPGDWRIVRQEGLGQDDELRLELTQPGLEQRLLIIWPADNDPDVHVIDAGGVRWEDRPA
jgi:hypothetical protein